MVITGLKCSSPAKSKRVTQQGLGSPLSIVEVILMFLSDKCSAMCDKNGRF